jgi:amino acid adenylation domain-containing protein/non-ribosomal peptide synthase protein (TIGR01720 family)
MPPDIEAVAALSPMQQGLLFHSLLDPGAGVYVNQHVISLRGPLDTGAFERAWREVVRRHQVFRASFHWEDVDTALMAVWRAASLDVDVHDWREHGRAEQDARLRAFLARDKARGFVLTAAPLMRVTLFRRADDEWWCYWCNHHLILDGWSAALVAREAFLAYAAFYEGRTLELPVAPAFMDYLAWLQRQDLAAAETFWRGELGDLRAITAIAGDVEAGGPQTTSSYGQKSSYGQRQLRLSTDETRDLQQLARRQGTTLSVIAQTAWAIVLSHYTRESDSVFGVTSSGRPPDLPDVESMAGLFINTLPLRLRVAREQPLAALIARTHEQNLRVRAVEYSPLASVQTWSGLPAGAPLFESILVFENYPIDRVLTQTVAGLAVEGIQIDEATNYPLSVTIGPGAELLLQITFDAARFGPARIERLLRHYRAALLACATMPQGRVGEVCLLDDSEWEQVRSTWQGPRVDVPLDARLHHRVERQVERTPEATAVRFGEIELTYAALNARANALARDLMGAGVGPGVLVGVAMERSLELVIALLAILKAGGAYVPLDPEYPRERLAFQIGDAAAPVVLVQARFAALFDDVDAGTRVMTVDAGVDESVAPPGTAGADADPVIASVRYANPVSAVRPDDAAYVIYTSGSTGRPKGVVNTHRAICNRLIWMQRAFPLDASDRVLQKTPYGFDVSVWEFFWPLMTGATLVVARPGGHRDAAYVADLIADERITTVHFVPPMLDAVLDEPRFDRCVSLTRVICSGEALTWDVQRRFFERSRAELHNLYGPTEAAVDVTWWPCRPEMTHAAVPIGRPIDNIEILLLDDDRQPVPVGVAGELWIGGVGLAQGYWRRPALTAERFAPHPFGREPGARLYRTGDLARYREDGAIEYLGRLDHQVKIRGFRIELGEIEAALASHEAVRQAIVVVQDDDVAGRRLVAYIVGEGRGKARANADAAGAGADADADRHPDLDGSAVSALPVEDLRAHLARTLPPYMVPDVFVPLDALPLTHNGKVDRRALPAARQAAGAPATPREIVTPRTALEEALFACWTEVLQQPAIGVTDSFFELGGHSLLATRLVSRIRSRLQIDLPLRALLEAPTIERLARAIAALNAGRAQERPIVRAPRDRDLPLSFAQQRMWYVSQLDPTGIAYNIPLVLELDGELDEEALETSLRILINRHEPLRTSFAMADGGPVQRVREQVLFRMDRIDLSQLAGLEQTASLTRVAELVTDAPFDLEQAPLLRAALIDLGGRRHRLVLALHHVIADGGSLDVLARELTVCYAASRQGAAPQLPDLPFQYVDYAQWERDAASGDDETRDLEDWVARLRDTPRLTLPYDRARPALQTFRGGAVSDVVSADIAGRVQAIGQAQQASPFATLLAAFQILMARVTGQQDVCVGTPAGNRARPELEGLVGLFVNTVALRTRLDLREPFRANLARTRETVVHALERAHVPFERIIDALRLEREPSRQPLVDVMFVVADSPIEQLQFADLRLRSVDVESNSAKFDLLVACQPTPGGLRLSWQYNADLFDATTITRLADAFRELLGAIAADPDAPLQAHDILPAAERARLLGAWAGHSVPLPAPAVVSRIFDAQVRARPAALAVISPDARLTYADLDRRANAIAAALIAAGVRAGDRVAIAVERSPAQIAALLGILKAGAAYVPLDSSWPAARLRHVLTDVGARVLVSGDAERGRLGACGVGIEDGLQIVPAEDAPLASHREEAREAGGVRDHDLAYVSYTSGSTGEPKGVAITHRAIVRLVTGQDYADVGEGRRVLVGAPLAFDASTFEIWGPLLSGGACVLLPPGVPDSAAIRAAIARDGADTAWLTAALFNALVDEAPDAFGGLRQVLTGGEALSVRHVRAFRAAHPACRLVNGYGPTESTTFATWHDVPCGDAAWLAEVTSIPIGRPLANTTTYVLDAGMTPLPIGSVGELYLGGEGLARGYWGRPELTAESFVPNPFADAPGGGRLYRTGDLVRWRTDGALDFVGRADDQVKIRGHRIEPAEVEHALRACAGVQAGAVVVERRAADATNVAEATNAADVADGAGVAGARLVAYYVPETLEPDDVRRELEGRLPAYMVPSAYVALARLPITAQGKVDRHRLPRPDEAAPRRPGSPSRPPSNAVEEAIVRIWREVLGVAAIGVDENFFAIGGDSLACLRVCERARSVGLSITLAQMLRHQTIASLTLAVQTVTASTVTAEAEAVVAGAVASGAAEAAKGTAETNASKLTGPAAAGRRSDARVLPLSASQQFFFEFAARDLHHYNLAQMFALRAPLSRAQLEAVAQALAARHDALRLRFRQAEDGWRAVLADAHANADADADANANDNAAADANADADAVGECARAVATVDHSTLDDGELDAALEREAARWQASLDLTHGPLFRLVSIDRGPHRPARLFAVVHHLAADGTSLWLLRDDLRVAVEQAQRHEQIRLAPSGANWAQWVARLAAEARSAAARAAAGHWLAPRTDETSESPRATHAATVAPDTGVPPREGASWTIAAWPDQASASLARLPPGSGSGSGGAAGALPRDRAAGANTQASERDVVVTWSAGQTRALLEAAARDGVEIGHLVLAAVGRAVASWTSEAGALVDWVAHGREPLFEDLDVSRTVGYFSTRTPLWLAARPGTLSTLARAARDSLRSLPYGAVGFGLLRYMSSDDDVRRRMAALPRPEIGVNYLGRHLGSLSDGHQAHDADADADAPTPTRDPVGPTRAATQQRPRLIRVMADIADQRLRLVWKFSANIHDASTIDRLAADVSTSLARELTAAAGPARKA